MPKYDPDEMAARGRIGGLTTQARHGRAASSHATRGFLDKFLKEVDPDGVLSEDERSYRAEMALRAHMARLAHERWKKNPKPARGPRKGARGDE